MPRSAASRSRALTVSAPASWPAATDRPRCLAQRPLPSVMMATYEALTGRGSSHLEDLVFLALEQGVELLGLLVGELLQRLLGAVLVVGAGLARVAQLAQVVHYVAADVADRDAPLLRELPAPLLGQLGDRKADQLAVVGGREPDVGLHDRPLDRLDRALVVRLDGQQARLGGVDRRELLQRRLRAVVVDHDAVEQARAGAPRADGAELAAR